MGADVAKREQRAVFQAAQHHRLAQQHLAPHLAGAQAGGQRRHVPEVAQEQIARDCESFRHGNCLEKSAFSRKDGRKNRLPLVP
jgi:hypothetical protein